MSSWQPEPGDEAYHHVEVEITEDDTPISFVQEDDYTKEMQDSETVDISLLVHVIDVESNVATVEKFGEREKVPTVQLSPEPRTPDCVYPTGDGSPYTSMEEVIDELQAEREEER